MTEGPDPDRFLSGTLGSPGGRAERLVRRAGDRLLDARLALAGRRLDELAGAAPVRDVLVLSVYRGDGGLLPHALAELRDTRHRVRSALGAMGAPVSGLEDSTVARDLGGGKFENLNTLLEGAEGVRTLPEGAERVRAAGAAGGADWTLVVDDDVALPGRFLDRFLGVCERFDLALAQPAQSLASHAAWPVTRRRHGSLVRETRFVEIGPVTAFRRDALAELAPFPPLRYGWGLDLHWAAVAQQRGWRLGIVDALPVRHERAGVAGAYSSSEAVAEARRFLADRPFLDRDAVLEAVRVHPVR